MTATFRADFEVTADIVLRKGDPPIVLKGPDVEVSLLNGPDDAEGHVQSLRALVVGQAEELGEAVGTLRHMLVRQLDMLTFVTHSRFKIKSCLRVIEWTAGACSRKAISMADFDERMPPAPELNASVAETIQAIQDANLPGFVAVAMRSFRYGCVDQQAEDQFQRFFTAIEIVAENVIGKQPVVQVCAACKVGLICSACGKQATRTPMGRLAIEKLIRPFSDEPAITAKRLFTTRNGLVHGRPVSSIEAELDLPMTALADIAGILAWHSVMSVVDPKLPPGPPREFFTHGTFIVGSVNMGATVIVEVPPGNDHPTDEQIPNLQISMQTMFRPQEAPPGRQ